MAEYQHQFRGRTTTLKQLSTEFGVPHTVIYKRLALGWSLEKAATTLPQSHSKIDRTKAYCPACSKLMGFTVRKYARDFDEQKCIACQSRTDNLARLVFDFIRTSRSRNSPQRAPEVH